MRTKLVIAQSSPPPRAVSAVGASAYTESIIHGQATKVIGYTSTAITGADMTRCRCSTTAPVTTRSRDRRRAQRATRPEHAVPQPQLGRARHVLHAARDAHVALDVTTYTCSGLTSSSPA